MRFILSIVLTLGVLITVVAQRTISGKVTDQNGNGIASVSISIIGHSEGTITDLEGAYRISVPDDYAILVFKYSGAKTQEIHVGSQTVIDIRMDLKTDSVQDSDDVINTGLGGSASKKTNTGNVSQVSGDAIRDNPVSNLEASMQGRTAGVIVKSTGVQVRGSASLTASNEPLYVVDGVPLASGNQSNINPANIKSMEILKDASAAAIYGSRAANGVIVITTHSGSPKKMQIEADYQIGFSSTPKYLDLYSPQDFNAQVLEGVLRGPLFNSTFSDYITRDNLYTWLGNLEAGSGIQVGFTKLNEVSFLSDLTYNTDWQKRVFRNAMSHRGTVSVQGGTEKLGYFVSSVYNTQEGILIGRNSRNFNGLISLNSKINSKLAARMSLNIINDVQDRLREDQDLGAPLQAIALPPSDAPDPSNNYYLNVFKLLYNPETEILNSTNQSTNNGLIGSLGLTFKLNEQLSFDATFGMDASKIEDVLVLGGASRDGGGTYQGNGVGRSTFGEASINNYIVNGWATYKPAISENNELSVVVGSSYEQSTGDFSTRSANVATLNELKALQTGDPALLNNPIPGSANSFVSIFSRVNYSINDRYLFQVSGRYDGSSKFAEENRFGTFMAVSGGWIISEEDFFGDGLIKFLKLKASYGQIGNTPIDDFGYVRNYGVVNYGANQAVSYDLINLANSDLKWESTSQLNVGLEYSLGARVSGTFDYFKKSTEDLLFPVPVSPSSGFSSIFRNGGSMENSGFEVSLSATLVDLDDIQWTTDFNITFSQNKITDLGGRRLVLGSNAFLEGYPASSFYLRKYVGVDRTTGEALYDNGNGGTTTDWESAPRQVVGNPNPGYFGGLTNSVSYKNFDLSFMFQFVGDVDRYFATGEYLANSGIQGLTQLKSQNDRWYNEGDIAKYPRLDPTNNDTQPSTRWLEDGSYVRLTNVILTYNLPEAIYSKLKLTHAEVYVGAQNLWTISNYTGYDPDVVYEDPTTGTIGQNINKGVDNFTAPQPRIITAGIKIGL